LSRFMSLLMDFFFLLIELDYMFIYFSLYHIVKNIVFLKKNIKFYKIHGLLTGLASLTLLPFFLSFDSGLIEN